MTQPLTARQLVILVLLGAGFWFLGAMMVRLLLPWGLFEPALAPLAFALAVPLLYPAIPIARRAAGLAPGQLFPAVSIATMAAMFLDGIAFRFFHRIYGEDQAMLLGSAAWILWGAAVGMLLAYLMDRRAAG